MGSDNYRKDILVKVDTTRFKFPDICPVCGDRAVDHGLIARSVGNKQYSTKPYYPRYSYRSRTSRPRITEVRRLKIPVCDKHFYSIDEMGRVRAILTFTGGISVALTIAIGIVMAFLLYDNLVIPIPLYTLLLFSFSVMAFSLYVLGPSKIERMINIIDFDNSDQTIILRIKNRWYVDELLRMNSSSAQIVSYVMKPRF
ncbi:MAG: hypothetical protein ACTSV2_16450 [Candidatus Thorarchaeota archaeon]